MTIKTDTGTYIENPRVLQLPPAGGRYVDDLADIEVLRFTDERDGNGGSFSTAYSVWDSFNRDCTRVWFFQQRGSYYIGKLNPDTLERVGLDEVAPARLPDGTGAAFVDLETANWSNLDADKLFVAADCRIWSYRPSTRIYTEVANLTPFFPAGARFNQLYVSRDDNRFAAVVRAGSSGSGDYGCMVFELSSSTVKLNVSMDHINGITMDKSGRYVFLVREDQFEGQTKQFVYNVDTGAQETLVSDATTGAPDYCLGHNDCADDFVVGGDQWNGAFTVRKMSAPHGVGWAWKYATSINGWILGWHVSMLADNPSWTLVSTYGGFLTRDAQGNSVTKLDGPFIREIFQLGVGEPFVGQFRRLLHTRANWDIPVRNYWASPRGAISPDGRFVSWTGNNNQPADTGRTDVFIARIPPAPTSTEPPIEPPTKPPVPPIEPPPIPTPPIVKPPTAAITAPANGANVKGVITVTATVTDASEAYLMVDDVISSMKTTAPYEFQLDTTKLSEGDHSLWVRAWSANGVAGDSEKVGVVVANAVVVPPEPPQPKPCSITAPTSITIPRNSSGVIAVQLNDLTGPVTVSVTGSDGQVTVTPLSWNAGPISTVKQFQVKVKNKKQVREIKFQSGCGNASVKVNVT